MWSRLASRSQTNASALFRLLRALESIGFFTNFAGGLFQYRDE